MANKKFMDFTTDLEPSGANYILEANASNGVRKTTIENAVAATNCVTNLQNKVNEVFVDNAAAHNGIFRGNDITAYFESGEMSNAIADRSFKNIYIGDYIKKSMLLDGTRKEIKWEVAHLNYFHHIESVDTDTPHVVLFPSTVLKTNIGMNDTNTTAGGYIASKMWTEVIPELVESIEEAFGAGHVLKHTELLSNNMDATASGAAGAQGAASNFDWKIAKANLPSENMIFGSMVFGSSGYDVGNKAKQLAIMNFKNYSEDRKWFWIQAIASLSKFVAASDNGFAQPKDAATIAATGGVRPFFLLK